MAPEGGEDCAGPDVGSSVDAGLPPPPCWQRPVSAAPVTQPPGPSQAPPGARLRAAPGDTVVSGDRSCPCGPPTPTGEAVTSVSAIWEDGGHVVENLGGREAQLR